MKLGVALTGSDKNYEILPCVINAFKKYSLDISSFAVTNNLFTPFLYANLKDKYGCVPYKARKLKRFIRRKGINNINKINVPLLVCNRDINLNCDVFFGNKIKIDCYNCAYFNDIKLTRLINLYKKHKAISYKRYLLSSGYISKSELLRALMLLKNDSYIIINIVPFMRFNEAEEYTENSNRCITLNLYIDENKPAIEQVNQIFEKNISKIYDFLFF